MGLSNFPSAAEGVLPILVMNTVMSMAILKNLIKSVLQLMGASAWISSNFEENPSQQSSNQGCPPSNCGRRRSIRGVSITQFKCLCSARERGNGDSTFAPGNGNGGGIRAVECCVCLCKFGEEEEVSELSCKHFFHRNCLDKWFDNHHSTCPLCRSIH